MRRAHEMTVIFLLASIFDRSASLSQPGPQIKSLHHEIICRDRVGDFPPEKFQISSCSMCFGYLFPLIDTVKRLVVNGTVVLATSPSVKENSDASYEENNISNKNLTHQGQRIQKLKTAHVDSALENETSFRLENPKMHPTQRMSDVQVKIIRPDVMDQLSFQDICNDLTESQCKRWHQCCQAAHQCCERQVKKLKVRRVEVGDVIQKCPITWDGYSCVEETPAGEMAHLQCPSFIASLRLRPGAQASRQCLENGTWWRSPETHMEWTDYAHCLAMDIEAMKIAQLVAISCGGVSIICLIPTTFIFLCLRALRCQLRIKIHICLFLSMLMSAIAGLLWEWMAMYDRLVSSPSHTFEHESPTACKVLNILTRLTKAFTYFWMLCEGFHLLWLMVQSYKAFTNIILFVFIGWGLPCILVLGYALLRLNYFDDDLCWISTTGKAEWIINGPIIACIGLNFLFLVIILRTLCHQLNAHDDNAVTIRKTARALFILIPVFGLQQFVILYRPDYNADGYIVYEIISAIIENSQGILVALVLCVFNSEVRTHLKRACRHWHHFISNIRQTRRQSAVSLTVMTSSKRQSVSSLTPRISAQVPDNSTL